MKTRLIKAFAMVLVFIGLGTMIIPLVSGIYWVFTGKSIPDMLMEWFDKYTYESEPKKSEYIAPKCNEPGCTREGIQWGYCWQHAKM